MGQALGHLETAADYLDGTDAPFDQGWTWFMQGWVGLKTGDNDLALGQTKRSLEGFVDVRDTSALLLVLESLAAGRCVWKNRSSGEIAWRGHWPQVGNRVPIQDVDINRYQELKTSWNHKTKPSKPPTPRASR